ncbi:MAG: ATP-binding protein, partial [Candidatus Methylomirabilales bacterium]
SIELVRELVNNAYDADATEVRVTVGEEAIVVEDDGIGMDLDGLRQYFLIGSQEKLEHPKSPRFGRDRIGQFGIGKFATLSACQRFEVLTRREESAARVIFDKEEWTRPGGEWRLPLETLPRDPFRCDGTTVKLQHLTRRFDVAEVERRLKEGVPLKAPHFAVFVNGARVRPKSLVGHRLPILEGTPFGPVDGEVVILPASAGSREGAGIEVKVKQVTIRRELFGAEEWGKVVARLRGEVHADFLPITSDRSGFILDSPEYQAFVQVMQKVMGEVRQVLGRLTGQRERRAASRALNDALERIARALLRNPDFSPFGALPLGEEGGGPGGAAVHPGRRRGASRSIPARAAAGPPRRRSRKKARVKRLTPDAVVRRLKMGHVGISCCLDHFGEDGPESFSEGTVIYINQDHPLYRREAKRGETYIMHLARLLTQEIALMKDPRNPRQAFERQSKLLRDAFVEG